MERELGQQLAELWVPSSDHLLAGGGLNPSAPKVEHEFNGPGTPSILLDRPNNGMHPTANQRASHARLGRAAVECAAGDAERYAVEVASMPLYTFIMEYAGGTYISQIKASSPQAACVKGAQSIDVFQVNGLGEKSKESLIEEMKAEAPISLDSLQNVWCASALIRGELALIHVILTESVKKKGQ